MDDPRAEPLHREPDQEQRDTADEDRAGPGGACTALGTDDGQGTRVLVRLDASTLPPTPWTDAFRAVGRELLRPGN